MDKEFLSQIDGLGELIPDPKLENEIIICECFCVNVADIRELCADQKQVDVNLLESTYSFGQGCQSCVKKIESWVHNIF